MAAPQSLLPFIHRCKTLYSKIIAKAGNAHHLSQTECDILLFLYHHPKENTATQISQKRLIAKSNVSTAIELLKQNGFLETKTDEENRRLVRLFLTKKTDLLLPTLLQGQKDFEEMLWENIPLKEKETLEQILLKLNANAMLALGLLEREKKE